MWHFACAMQEESTRGERGEETKHGVLMPSRGGRPSAVGTEFCGDGNGRSFLSFPIEVTVSRRSPEVPQRHPCGRRAADGGGAAARLALWCACFEEGRERVR